MLDPEPRHFVEVRAGPFLANHFHHFPGCLGVFGDFHVPIRKLIKGRAHLGGVRLRLAADVINRLLRGCDVPEVGGVELCQQ